jgi:hypothetical protein
LANCGGLTRPIGSLRREDFAARSQIPASIGGLILAAATVMLFIVLSPAE